MELVDQHITFTIDEIREAISEGNKEEWLKKISGLIEYGYEVSVHTRYAGDISFASVDELKAYVKKLS